MTIEDQQNSIEGEVAILSLQAIQASLESGKPIEVKVKRSDGKIESGWSIVQMFLGEGDEPVKVKVVGESGSKIVSLDSVQKWNNPEEVPRGKEAILTPESIHDLLGKNQDIEVSVKRSSGEIEPGWKVTDLYVGVGNEPVRVKVVNGLASKIVSLNDLKEWNIQDEIDNAEERPARDFNVRPPTEGEINRGV